MKSGKRIHHRSDLSTISMAIPTRQQNVPPKNLNALGFKVRFWALFSILSLSSHHGFIMAEQSLGQYGSRGQFRWR